MKDLKITEAMRRHFEKKGGWWAEFVKDKTSLEEAIMARHTRSHELGVQAGEQRAGWKKEDDLMHRLKGIRALSAVVGE